MNKRKYAFFAQAKVSCLINISIGFKGQMTLKLRNEVYLNNSEKENEWFDSHPQYLHIALTA
jgi:hypothetical protein